MKSLEWVTEQLNSALVNAQMHVSAFQDAAKHDVLTAMVGRGEHVLHWASVVALLKDVVEHANKDAVSNHAVLGLMRREVDRYTSILTGTEGDHCRETSANPFENLRRRANTQAMCTLIRMYRELIEHCVLGE